MKSLIFFSFSPYILNSLEGMGFSQGCLNVIYLFQRVFPYPIFLDPKTRELTQTTKQQKSKVPPLWKFVLVSVSILIRIDSAFALGRIVWIVTSHEAKENMEQLSFYVIIVALCFLILSIFRMISKENLDTACFLVTQTTVRQSI